MAAVPLRSTSSVECIPEAPLGSVPGLEIAGCASTGREASVGGRSRRSVATLLSEKGLEGVPIAERHFSKKTGEPYWRFRNSAGKGYYIKKDDVQRLGFAFYPHADNLTKGMLKNPRTGRFVSYEHARTVIGSIAGSDIATLHDVQDLDELPGIDEESDFDETSVQCVCRESSCEQGTSWFIRVTVSAMALALALHVVVSDNGPQLLSYLSAPTAASSVSSPAPLALALAWTEASL